VFELSRDCEAYQSSFRHIPVQAASTRVFVTETPALTCTQWILRGAVLMLANACGNDEHHTNITPNFGSFRAAEQLRTVKDNPNWDP
jgi:hypothetical protein